MLEHKITCGACSCRIFFFLSLKYLHQFFFRWKRVSASAQLVPIFYPRQITSLLWVWICVLLLSPQRPTTSPLVVCTLYLHITCIYIRIEFFYPVVWSHSSGCNFFRVGVVVLDYLYERRRYMYHKRQSNLWKNVSVKFLMNARTWWDCYLAVEMASE